MPVLQDSVMQELNARHSASVAAKLDALKQQQQQQQQHGQGQHQGAAPWGQQQGSRQLPGRSLSPGSDFWRQSQQDKQQPASQGLQEVTLQGLLCTGTPSEAKLRGIVLCSISAVLQSKQFSVCNHHLQLNCAFERRCWCTRDTMPVSCLRCRAASDRRCVTCMHVRESARDVFAADWCRHSCNWLQGYKKPAPMAAQHNYHITTQVCTALVHMLVHMPPATCCMCQHAAI